MNRDLQASKLERMLPWLITIFMAGVALRLWFQKCITTNNGIVCFGDWHRYMSIGLFLVSGIFSWWLYKYAKKRRQE